MQGCTNFGRQVAVETKFFVVAPDFTVFSVLNLLQITFTAPEILEWLLDFYKIRASLAYDLFIFNNFIFSSKLFRVIYAAHYSSAYVLA